MWHSSTVTIGKHLATALGYQTLQGRPILTAWGSLSKDDDDGYKNAMKQ